MKDISPKYFHELHQFIIKTASRIYKKGQEHDPMIFACKIENGKLQVKEIIDVSGLLDERMGIAGKDLLAKFVREKYESGKYDLVATAIESWGLKFPKNISQAERDKILDQARMHGLSSMKEKFEIFVVMIYSIDQHWLASHPINRKKKMLMFAELKKSEGEHLYVGRYAQNPSDRSAVDAVIRSDLKKEKNDDND